MPVMQQKNDSKRIILFSNTDWYLYNFRMDLAKLLILKGYDVICLATDTGYADKIRAEGIKFEPIPFRRRGLNPFFELYALSCLARYIWRLKPDLIHSFTIKPVLYGGIVGFILGIPRIHSIDGLGSIFARYDIFSKFMQQIVGMLLKISFWGSRSYLLVQNKDDLNLLLDLNAIDKDRASILHGVGVNMSKFNLDMNRRNKHTTGYNVLMASRMLRSKGVLEYIASAKEIGKKDGSIKFLLAGMPDYGNPESISIDELRSWEVNNNIKWLQHVDNMPQLLHHADLVVLPTYYREGFPTILAEAAVMSLPIITTDMPGCRDAVIHNVDGVLIPPRNVNALIESILCLRNNPKFALTLGRNAREKALRQYDINQINSEILKIYFSMTLDINEV